MTDALLIRITCPSQDVARLGDVCESMDKEQILVMNLCGRGDKDIFSVAEHLGMEI